MDTVNENITNEELRELALKVVYDSEGTYAYQKPEIYYQLNADLRIVFDDIVSDRLGECDSCGLICEHGQLEEFSDGNPYCSNCFAIECGALEED